MITKNKRWRLLALFAVFAMVLAACGDTAETTTTAGEGADDTTPTTEAPDDTADETTTTEAAPAGGGTVTGALGEPPAIDPQLVSDSEGFEVARLLYDGLTLYDPAGGAVVPGSAESWEANEDNTVFTFHLRDGLTFSDGSPVTAESFALGFNRLADPDLGSSVSYHGTPILGWSDVTGGEPSGTIGDDQVEGVTAVDDLTFQVTTAEPFVFLPKVVAHPAFSPIPEAALTAEDWAEQPIGNGPYMMAGPWEHEVGMSLVRNESYAGPRPQKPDNVEFLIFADQVTSGFQAFLDGQLDVFGLFPENEDQAADLGYEFTEVPTGSFTYVGFPTDVAPYDDPEMRKALVQAVDREAIATRILKRQVANGFVPPGATGSIDGECDACVFDPEGAKATFDELGGIPGNSVTLSFNAGAGHEDWIEAIANDWTNNLGLDVTFESLEWAAYLEFLGIGAEDVTPTQPFRLGWLWDYPSAYNFLDPLYGPNSEPYITYQSEDLNALLVQAATAPSEEEAIPYLEDAQRVLAEDMPVMPIVYGLTKWVQNEGVANVQFNDFGFFIWEDMEVTG